MKILPKYKEIIRFQGDKYGVLDRVSKENRCNGCCFQRNEGSTRASCAKPWLPFYHSCSETFRHDKCYIIYKKIL